jgi:murein DD-endopeptidase MepM/ murein hydrolase activator NlpD
MLLKVSDYNSLRTDREALKSRYRTLQDVVSQTNAKLTSLQSLATEVALTYGFVDPQRTQFPEGLLAVKQSSTADSTYSSWLDTFKLMKNASVFSIDSGALPPLADLRVAPAAIPSICPVLGPVTAGFGQRMDPFSGEGAFHSGLDISAPYGTDVDAAAEGLAFYVGPDQDYGNEVLIDHGYGIKTKYGHLSRIYVMLGQNVKRGQAIGAVGTSGKATGPHLHYEVLIHETPVNPTRFLHG